MKCGGCTWCCFHPAVKELGKPIQEWCVHCKDGCLIYEDRPKSCSTYECVYFQDELMPEEFRPDRCGVMFEVPYGSKNKIYALIDPSRPNAWKTRRMKQLIGKFNNAGYKVMIRSKYYDSGSI